MGGEHMDGLASFDPLLDKLPKGVISKGDTVRFKIKVDLKCTPNEAYLMIKSDDDTDYKYILMDRKEDVCEAEFTFLSSGHYFYNFKLNYNDFCVYLSKSYDSYCVVLNSKGDDFFQLVTKEQYDCTDSLQGGLIYQILVDRFCRDGKVFSRQPLILRDDWGGKIKKNSSDPLVINREVFGGNFKGVTKKLKFLAELGVTTIYFNPISLANSHHKYDTADYMTLDDMYGSEDDFVALISKAKSFGIKVIIDGVYNHTGSDSIYFNKYGRFNTLGAYNSKDSKYAEWYRFINYPEVYESWWGIDTLPSIKRDSESFHNFIAGENGVIEKFMKFGVFGVRLDVVDEISDEFTKMISDKVHSFDKNAVVMGEVWEDASTKISYSQRRKYFSNNELNSVMNYPIRESILEYIKSKEPYTLNFTLRMLVNGYPKVVLDNLMNFLGTHDTPRIFSELKGIAGGNEALAKCYYKIAMCILFTVPGVPSIFYGDEYAMENNDGSSRGCFDWENYNNDIFNWTKNLATIRKYKVFAHGDINVLFHSNGKFVFERFDTNEHIVVCTNLRPSPLKVCLKGKYVSFFTGSEVSDFSLNENSYDILIEIKE